MKFSFIIPAYNNYYLLHTLLWDIRKNCSPIHEVIVVDDDSSDTTFLNGLSWWVNTGLLPIQHIRPIDNLGFLKASNRGLKEATGDIVCLVSTDVRIHKDIVNVSKTVLDELPKSLLGGRLLNFDTGWNTFGDKTFWYLEGWLLISSKDNWKELGYFDERYSPNDMEDIDISTRAIELGYNLLPISNEYVSHIGAQSIPYSPERESLTIRNKKKFEEKWVK